MEAFQEGKDRAGGRDVTSIYIPPLVVAVATEGELVAMDGFSRRGSQMTEGEKIGFSDPCGHSDVYSILSSYPGCSEAPLLTKFGTEERCPMRVPLVASRQGSAASDCSATSP